MRHLHPQEVAILCGLFPSHVSPHAAIPLKLDLAGVGQLASPIQSTWICAQVMHAMGIQGLVDPQPTPHQRLGNLLKALLQERDQLVKRDTPTTSMQLFTQGLESMFGDFSAEESLTQELARTIDHFDAQDDRSEKDQAVEPNASPVRPPGPEHPSMSWEGFGRVPASEHQMSEANSSASAVQRRSAEADHASVPSCPGLSVRSAKGPIRSMSSPQELHHIPSHEPSHEIFHAMPPLPFQHEP